MALPPTPTLENGHGYPLSPDLNGTNGINGINGNGNGINGTASTSTAFDTELFTSYLLSLLPPVIGATREELEETLFDAEYDERVTRFASEGGNVLYVQKVKEEDEGLSQRASQIGLIALRHDGF